MSSFRCQSHQVSVDRTRVPRTLNAKLFVEAFTTCNPRGSAVAFHLLGHSLQRVSMIVVCSLHLYIPPPSVPTLTLIPHFKDLSIRKMFKALFMLSLIPLNSGLVTPYVHRSPLSSVKRTLVSPIFSTAAPQDHRRQTSLKGSFGSDDMIGASAVLHGTRHGYKVSHTSHPGVTTDRNSDRSGAVERGVKGWRKAVGDVSPLMGVKLGAFDERGLDDRAEEEVFEAVAVFAGFSATAEERGRMRSAAA